MKFTKKDLVYSIITGLTAGIVAWRVLVFLGTTNIAGFSLFLLVLVVPVLWILGVNLGYFLGKWMPFFNQFGKFAAIGFTNFAVDTGVLNLLIGSSGVASGIYFSVFKTISFMAGVSHSYLWNKIWVFESSNDNKGGEIFKFLTVAVLSILVNVGVASFIVNYVDPKFGFDDKIWANIGSVVGSAVALVFSFVGFKLLVFKKKEDALPQIPS